MNKHSGSKAGPLPVKAALSLSPAPPKLKAAAKVAAKVATPDFSRSRSQTTTETSDTESEHGAASDGSSSENEDVGELSLLPGLKRLTLNGLQPPMGDVSATSPVSPCDSQLRYHGKSSALKLIGATRKFKEQYADSVSVTRSTDDAMSAVDDTTSNYSHASSAVPSAREQYWATPSVSLLYIRPRKHH